MIVTSRNKRTNKAAAAACAIVLALAFSYPEASFADTTLMQASAASAATAAQQAALQQQLNALQTQIAGYQQQLNGLKSQKNTLQNKLKQLKAQQNELQAQIQAVNLQITDLGNQVTATEAAIAANNTKISQLQSQIAQYITVLSQGDDQPVVYTLVSDQSFSQVWADLQSDSSITSGLSTVVDQTKTAIDELNTQQAALEQQQDAASNELNIQSLQQEQLADTASQQNQLIKETAGQESVYQAVISTSQSQADQIRGQLYQLTGVSTSGQIDFGQAVTIADQASAATGVRAAFLLAILSQESDLGANVGTCNRPGDPPSKSWKVVMKPDRDQQPFVQITQSLGLDTDTTPVSCPEHTASGAQLGWGGAMGPAQFIPSTWVGYEAQVSAITGKQANPWDISDAFLAAAIKLKAGGAGTQAGEWAAAMRYFSGGTNPAYSFYGDSVVAKAAQYQQEIDSLGN